MVDGTATEAESDLTGAVLGVLVFLVFEITGAETLTGDATLLRSKRGSIKMMSSSKLNGLFFLLADLS